MSRIPAVAPALIITNPSRAWVGFHDMHNAARDVRKLGEAVERILGELHGRVDEEGGAELAKATAIVAGELASSISAYGINLERDVSALDGLLSTSLLELDQAPDEGQPGGGR